MVVIDAAHGGADSGARLSDHLLEKDLVLTLSVRLRSMLSAHGISVVTTRESDSAIPALNRAETANHVGAAACITLHATTSGSGVHLFTSSLTQIPLTRFLPWETAQGAYAEQSLRLSSEFDSAMTHAEIPVTLGRTALAAAGQLHLPGGSGGVVAVERLREGDRALRPWVPGPDCGGTGRSRRTMAARLEATTVISRGQRILFWTLLVSSVLMSVVLLRMRERAHGPPARFRRDHAAQSSGRHARCRV